MLYTMIISTLSLLTWLKRRVEFETQVKQGRVKESFLIEAYLGK
jgi:hypothetical protein